jgi:hypothetical protein
MNDMQSIDETRNIAAAQGEHARFAGRVWKGALAWSLICLMAFAWRPGAAAQQSQKPSDWKIFIANDACSDYTWGDDEKQNRRDFADVVRAHLDEILQTKGQASQIDHYNLSITQEALAFAEYYPDRKEELIRRIKEGYIAVGPDYNNSLWGFQSTEGMIRTLYPARRLEKEWGLPLNDVAQHIEEPALPWGVAAILAGSGYHWLVAPFLDYDSTFSKLANPPLFVWEGAYGSRIRVIMDRFASEKTGYVQGAYLLRDPKRIDAEWLPHYQKLDGYPLNIILAAGTHGDNHPDKAHLASYYAQGIESYNAQPGEHPKLVNATYPMFCAAVDQAHPNLPVLRGDFGVSWDFWPVTLANYAAAERLGGQEYLSAETLWAVAALANPAAAEVSRPDRIQAEWDWIMLADHAWNGASDTNRDENARLRWSWGQDLRRRAKQLTDRAWSAAGLTADASHLTVFNPLSWQREDLVRAEVPETVAGVAQEGKPIASQIVEEDGKRVLYFVSPKIDAFGFSTLSLTPTPDTAGSGKALQVSEHGLESPRYKLRIDPASGRIVSLVDKATGHEIVTANGQGIGETVFFNGKEHRLENVRSQVVASGPVLARVKTTGFIPEDSVEVTSYATLYAGIDRVEFDIRIHKPVSTEEQRITHTFPVLAAGSVERVEQMGAIVRPTPAPGGDLLPGADSSRIAVQGFVDASAAGGPGVTITPLEAFALRQDLGGVTFEALGNDQNYKEVNKTQDGQTDFRFRYALRTHSVAYDSAKAAQWSRSYTVPLLVSFGQAASQPRPQIDLDPARAVATAFKPAEQEGTELRIWETAGSSGPLSIGVSGYREVFQTDLLERDRHSVPIVNGRISIDLSANSFAAVRLVP